jgi:hypothetical protein
MSASTSLPSANTTVRSVSRAMFGFGVDLAVRDAREDVVGDRRVRLEPPWSGFGSP